MSELNQLIKRYQEQYKDSLNYLEQHKILLTYNSTTLEGSTLSLIDVQLLVNEDRTPQGKPLEHALMVKDHFNALNFVIEKAAQKEPLTESLIKSINGLLREHTGSIRHVALGTFDERAGDYRLISVYANVEQSDGKVKPVSYPDCKKVPALMKDFIFYTNQQLNKVKSAEDIYNFAFEAHYHLRRIHPFSDGNSRTSRLLMNYIQHYHTLPLTPVSSLHRKEYIQSFYESDVENTLPMRTFLMNEAKQFLSDMIVHKVDKQDIVQLKHKKGQF